MTFSKRIIAMGLMAAPQAAWAQDIAAGAPLAERVAAWLTQAGQDHMSPMGMFMAADWVVKAVMLSLIFASLLTWIILIAKMADMMVAKARLKAGFRALDKRASLVGHPSLHGKPRGVLAHMIKAAVKEVSLTGEGAELAGEIKAGIKDRVGSELARIEAGAVRRKGAAIGILANIGSTAPFVGLFGTVWGIMNSFISISESGTTNLAVVAPGIAEALLATAIGLVAAIPAVIFYNVITRAIGGYRGMVSDAGALVERSLSRDLDLGRFPVQTRAPVAPKAKKAHSSKSKSSKADVTPVIAAAE